MPKTEVLAAVGQLNLDGEAPMHVACKTGHPSAVQQLLEVGADPKVPTSSHQSMYPIHLATKAGSSE